MESPAFGHRDFGRRDFGRLAALGVGGPALLAACGEGGGAHDASSVAANGAAAAARSWKVTGRSLSGLGGFDATVKGFMQARNIPCGQLAVARKGKLLLARGYTWSASTSLKTSPTSLFRIASLSKPITATAVLRLIQEGRLKPTDKVATLLKLPAHADPRLADVTVLRLLQHLGGWDRDKSPDPMFQDAAIAKALKKGLPVSRADIMRWESGRRLDHKPGTAYAYSNYGYMLLGRIIEKVSGQSYGAYVQAKVLGPRGIKRMKLAHGLTKAAGEVPYYSSAKGATVYDNSGKQVAYPYGGFNIENMDAHGGWLGTAVDLTRFARIYDGGTPVLNAASISRAFAKPETGIDPGGWYYGTGWMVRPVTGGRNTWHDGSLPGTSTLLVRRFDGLTWAVLFDQRQEGSQPSYGDIDGALHQAANAVRTWPTGDLYGSYF